MTPAHYGALLCTARSDDPDHRTTVADLRAAIGIAAGAEPDDIHPASGHDLSLRAYLSVRRSWAEHTESFGLNDWSRPHFDDAREYWEQHRPKYLADHPWPDA